MFWRVWLKLVGYECLWQSDIWTSLNGELIHDSLLKDSAVSVIVVKYWFEILCSAGQCSELLYSAGQCSEVHDSLVK